MGLVAADTLSIDPTTRVKSEVIKLHTHDSAPIVWGCAGNFQLGEGFASWLKSQDAPKEWKDFADTVISKVSKLNAQQRAYTKLSGADWNPSFGIDCLLVGWVGGAPNILEVESCRKALQGRAGCHLC